LEGFAQNGHKQIAVTTIFTDGEFSRRLSKLKIEDVDLPIGAFGKPTSLRAISWTMDALIRLPYLWMRWSRMLHQFRPDVILFTGFKQAVWLFPWLNTRPSFLIEYTYLDPTRTRHFVYWLLARKLTGFIAVSDFMRRHCIEIGAPAAKTHLIRSGVFSVLERPRIEKECSDFAASTGGTLRLGIVGQISPHKGHECLIDAIYILRGKKDALEVFVYGIGDREYTAKLKQKVMDLGVADVFHWMGYENDRAAIYRNVDVCVVPSMLGDPFPTVAMEAGAYGRPVIASRTGGLPEIVAHGRTGWLVEPGNSEDLAKHIERFIRNGAAIEEMGKAARDLVFSEFTQEKMVAQFEHIFDAVRDQEVTTRLRPAESHHPNSTESPRK
jgi:glycosyltransferase involved in cell wall biosynthesis